MILGRRRFLLHAAAGSAATVAVALPGCAPSIEPAPIADVPAPVNGKLSFEVARYPDLAKPDGAIRARAPGLAEPVLVARTPEGGFAALGSICTHLGCPVGFEPWEVVCPCHLSRFALDGRVTHPPARQGLPTYAVVYDAGTGILTIDLLAGDPGFPPVVGGKVFLSFAQFPQLLGAGGSVVGRPAGLGHPIAVVALAGGGYAALTAVCTHMGCTVGYNQADGLLDCPCHGSRFNLDGTVYNGPAVAPLATYGATATADGVEVTV